MVEWPDGTVASRYAFFHALHHHVVYQRLAAAQRVALHRRLGARAEAAYGARVGEIAAELAVHFEQGRDVPRAVHYLWQAAEKAVQRYANREALHHLTKGLTYLQTLPDTPERAWQELRLQMTLGSVLLALQGGGAHDG